MTIKSTEQASLVMTSAQAIVECMKKEKVDKVFCVPGESYLPLLDALYEEQTIDVITARHEGGAAFMAEGYAKAALKPGVVMATRGVGATNLSIGVHTAYQDSTPMVVFLGQVHSKFRGREGFQEVDLEQYFSSIAKWAVEVTHPERMPELVQRAFRIAKSGRPGPVIVSLPEDVLPLETKVTFGPTSHAPKPSPAKEELRQVEELLNRAEKPLIIAGGGVKAAQAEDVLVEFAEKNEIAVMSAFRRHDVFPNDHRLYAGHLGLGVNKDVLQTVQDADVVLALGTRLSEVTTQDYSIMTADKTLVHLDIDFEILGKVYPPEVGIVADAKEGLRAFMSLELNTLPWKKWAHSRSEIFRQNSKLEIADKDVINRKIIASLIEKLPSNALLTNDAGNFAGWLHAFYLFKEKHTYIGPTSGAMGYGMPAALGAKLAFPGKPVISLSGDGGFMMTVQEIETAVRHHIPIIALVFNNKMYGTIRMHQEMHYPEKVMATDLGEVNFANVAKSAGAYGKTVTTAEQFEIALERALDETLHKKRPAVIEIITDKEHISVSSTIEQMRRKQ